MCHSPRKAEWFSLNSGLRPHMAAHPPGNSSALWTTTLLTPPSSYLSFTHSARRDLQRVLRAGIMAEFVQAHKEFLDQLSDEEKKQFTPIKDSQTFLSEAKNLGQFAKSNRKWTRLFRTIQRCSDCLTPYFNVVGITVQSHPECAALAWGSFRLVLLASRPRIVKFRGYETNILEAGLQLWHVL